MNSNKKTHQEIKIPPSKFLTKEPSFSNPSFRVYYGKATGSVPFVWESQPGTPKHPTSTTPKSNDQYSLPPLSPPPSYYYYPESGKKKTKSHNLLHIILPKITLRRSDVSNRSSSSSSCSSSEPSSPAVVQKDQYRHAATARLSSPKTHLLSYKDGEEEDEGPHTLTLCFGGRR
ncbi:hypothetical protein LUZ62_040549 [Rhynchospora pubera]|uniref:Uncharacterized protein n=1 Tax=Rhynchospora pubera TaxID=906938 RepID=A0AAV8FEJ8_9POAL|nr:hypothetical protein LUZ62_040549 [Rhynchospora pubera]